jgi:hypothetical protein
VVAAGDLVPLLVADVADFEDDSVDVGCAIVAG